jgi:hypothetical protein
MAKPHEVNKTVSVLETLFQFQRGLYRMTRQQFRNCLRRSIGATMDYADECWVPFQNNSVGYICSRTHLAQQLELIKVCMKLGKKK